MTTNTMVTLPILVRQPVLCSGCSGGGGGTPGFDDDLEAALGAIQAKAIAMSSRTDLYFPPDDSEYEVSRMPNAELRPISSIWGHFAGSGRDPEDVRFIDNALKELLAG